MSPLFPALISVGLSVPAQFRLKAGMSSQTVAADMAQPLRLSLLLALLVQPYLLSGFVLYGLGAAIWLMVLAQWDVSKAYPFVGLGFAFKVLIGLMLGEHVTIIRGIGVATICAGVWIVSRT